jgi:hypothetical protein
MDELKALVSKELAEENRIPTEDDRKMVMEWIDELKYGVSRFEEKIEAGIMFERHGKEKMEDAFTYLTMDIDFFNGCMHKLIEIYAFAEAEG